MKTTSKPIIFFGTEDFSLTVLTGLLEAGLPIAAVVTKPDSPRGRGRHLATPKVKQLATSQGIPVWQPDRLSAVVDSIMAVTNPIGVLASYGKIIPPAVLQLFHPGIINVHPSLLPRHRGPTPIESAILAGDKQTGVSIMRLAERVDAGPIYAQINLPLSGQETRPELYQSLAVAGTDLLLNNWQDIIDGKLTAKPQDERQATYTNLIQKQDLLLDPATQTADEAERRVRAFLGLPGAKLVIGKLEITILRASVVAAKTSALDIKFSDDSYLSIDQLIAPSGKQLTKAEFLRGYRV